MNTETPRTDAAYSDTVNGKTVPVEFARTLERELAEARKDATILNRDLTAYAKDNARLRKAINPLLVAVADRLACPESAVALRKLAEACDKARAALQVQA